MPRKKSWKKEFFQICKEHGLTIILILLLLSQLLAYWFQGLSEWRDEQIFQGGSTALWPDYFNHYMTEVWVSILADTYGALIIVFLTKYFYEKRSAESKKN